jgi:ABC-type transport system substrate-binding protein
MSYDRDLWIDTFYSVKEFEDEGLPLQTRYCMGGMTANVQGKWLLDAQNKIKGQELGDAAKFFTYNPAEAKKLLSAAGYPNGLETESHHVTTADYGAQAPKMIEVLLAMAADAGFTIKIVPEAYATAYRNNYRDAKGNFEGTSFVRVSLNDQDDPTNRLFSQYHKSGDLFKGFDVNGRTPGAGDPALDDLVVKMRGEFDLERRIALAHEVQKIDAIKNYYIRFPGGAESFSLSWPAVANAGVYKGGLNWQTYWIDDTKPPLKRA